MPKADPAPRKVVVRMYRTNCLKWLSLIKDAVCSEFILIILGIAVTVKCLVTAHNCGDVSADVSQRSFTGSNLIAATKGAKLNKLVVAVSFTLLICILDLEVWTVMTVMKRIGQDPINSVARMGWLWFKVKLVFVFFTLLGMIYYQSYYAGGVFLMWQCILLSIVWKFNQRFNDAVIDNSQEEEREQAGSLEEVVLE